MTHFLPHATKFSYNESNLYIQGVIRIENKLYFFRELHEMTQQDVADALSVSRSTYASYESGRRIPPIDVLMRLADLYAITLDELTGHEVKHAHALQLSQQALRMLKGFNQLPLPIQEWYIAHIDFDVKSAHTLAGAATPAIKFETVAETGQEK